MNIIFSKKAPDPIKRPNYLNYQKLGFWATVTEVNSKTNTCTILNSNREVIRNIPIATTKEWISDNSAERNLPPVGSFVFVIMPDNCISNAFILCSGYPRGETSLQGLYAKNDSEKATKNTEREILTPGSWTEKEDYKSGTKTITSPDSKIEIKASLTDKESKSLVIKAFNKTITLTEDGLSINASEDIEIKTDGKMNLSAESFNFNDGHLEIT